MPSRRLLVYGIVGGMLLAVTAILFFSSSLSNTGKESSIQSSDVVGNNSAALPDKSQNTEAHVAAPLTERSWLAVTRVEEPSAITYDGGNELDRRSFVSYNSEAPRSEVTPEMLSKIPSLKKAFEGADGCQNGTEVCEVSYGFSEGGDENNYELSISKEEARTLREEVRLSAKTNDALLEYDSRLYWLVLYTSNEFRTPQMRTDFVEKVPIEPTPLGIGESLQYSVLIKTWSTYGGPVELKLYAESSSADSGVKVTVEPDSLVLDERSEQKVKVIITPTEKAKEGIYDIRMWGKFDNSQFFWPDSPCQHSACPSVKVGSSLWEVRNYAGFSGLGGNAPPEWLNLRLTTDKQVYKPGEKIAFTAYLDNNSTDSRLVLDDARLIINIYPSDGGPAGSVFNVDAMRRGTLAVQDDGGVSKPGSSIILAYPFEWDQRMMKDGKLSGDYVSPDRYTIDASFGLFSEGFVMYDEKDVTIVKE